MVSPVPVHLGTDVKGLSNIFANSDLTNYTTPNGAETIPAGLAVFACVSSARASSPADVHAATIIGSGTFSNPWGLVNDGLIANWGPGTEFRDAAISSGPGSGASTTFQVQHTHPMIGCNACLVAVGGVSGTVLNHYAAVGTATNAGDPTTIGATGFAAGNPVLAMVMADLNNERTSPVTPWDGSTGWMLARNQLLNGPPASNMVVYLAPKGLPASPQFIVDNTTAGRKWAVILAELELLPLAQRRSKGRELR